MGKIKLKDVLNNIDSFEDELTIYAIKPFVSGSECFIAMEPEDEHLPQIAVENSAEYFLEVFIVKELKEGLLDLEQDQFVDRIIYYAENDT